MTHRGAFFWGGALVLAGIILFLNNMGWLAVDVWKILLPGLVVLLGVVTLWSATRPRRTLPEESLQLPLVGAKRAKVQMRFGAGHLTVAGGAAGSNVADGSFRGGVEATRRIAGQEVHVGLRVPSDFFLTFLSPWTWWGGERLEWQARLTESVPLALDVETGASEASLDLSRLKLDTLRLASGASSVEVTMPAGAGRTDARIESGAASLAVEIPQGVAARIEIESGLANARVDTRRFPRSGKTYQSPDFDTAANRLDLHIEAGVASIDIR
jgi:hypothetical protein